MDDAAAVGVAEGAADGGDDAYGDFGLDGFFMGGVVEGLSFDELHDDVEHAVDVTRFVEGDEVRVVQAGHGLCFGFK